MKSKILVGVSALVLLCIPAPAQDEEEGQGDQPDPGSRMVVRRILPADTDPAITTNSGDGWLHWAYYDPSATDRHLLMVFLVGSGGKGGGGKAFLRLVASGGCRVVSLAYPSEVSVSHAGRRNQDPDAFLKARENLLYGRQGYMQFQTTAPNSICNRLGTLLSYMAAHFPKENWNQFTDGQGGVVWPKLVLAGQSQGGGHACLLAKQHEVARVIMFGSPKDYDVALHGPAKWFSMPGKTPLDRFFCFNHTLDDHNGCTYQEQLANYQALGLSPKYPVVNVDQDKPPYSHSRLFTSTRPTKGAHNAPLHDPVYRPTWEYLLTEPVTTTPFKP